MMQKMFISKQIDLKTAILNKLLKNKRELESALIDIEYKMNSSELQV